MQTYQYFFNGQLVARREGSAVRFFLTDHLGGTATTLTPSGAVEAQLRYDPWGNARWASGTTPTSYRYTGQREDVLLGLYDYRARYYDPSIGRFISADTLVPNPADPQAFNRYSYVLNRPINYIDPSGHFPWPIIVIGGGIIIGVGVGLALSPQLLPWNPPTSMTGRVTPITSNNMTGWLRNQMVTNAQSAVVQNIRDNWHSLDPIRKDAAMQAWTALVGTDATWDFKVDIGRTGWFRNGVRGVTLGNRRLNYNAIANIHYGFVGRAAGFGPAALLRAAGFAQLLRSVETGNSGDRGPCNLTYYCDHPYATWAIKFGIYLYEQFGDRLDELDDDALTQALEDYIAENGEPPDPPPGAVVP